MRSPTDRSIGVRGRFASWRRGLGFPTECQKENSRTSSFAVECLRQPGEQTIELDESGIAVCMDPDEPGGGRRVDPGPDPAGKIDASGIVSSMVCGIVSGVGSDRVLPARGGETIVVEIEAPVEATTAIDARTRDERGGRVARRREVLHDRGMRVCQKALSIVSDAMNRFGQARQNGRCTGGLTSAG